ncbi:MAG: DHHA1 domain-containing protein, partial [Desulfofustis sp.]|jgi:alanyl-tRNA synthetase|nr:DHHA1 domain-containing protein [Desulfofustis sp.]
VQALLDEAGQQVAELAAGGRGRLFVEATPFYAESGGQVGDVGTVVWPAGRATVETVRTEADGVILHHVLVSEGTLCLGAEVEMVVSEAVRHDTEANHSATHLLHAALRRTLGDHVKQAGSLVTPDRLRFDFTHFSALTDAEIEAVEALVNQQIRANRQVGTKTMSRAEAFDEGAIALFGEKYGETVRMVQIDAISKELCGGTHVPATGAIGLFKIVAETGIAAGVRRIEAVTGRAALELVQSLARREAALCRRLNTVGEELVDKLDHVLEQQKKLEKQVALLSTQLASSDLDSVFGSGVAVAGVTVVAAQITLDNAKTLREVGDRVRDRLGSGVAVLGGVIDGKAALIALVSKDLTGRIKAGELVNRVAQMVGGKGGGRPDMAQAGGPMADKISDAIGAVPGIVEMLLADQA